MSFQATKGINLRSQLKTILGRQLLSSQELYILLVILMSLRITSRQLGLITLLYLKLIRSYTRVHINMGVNQVNAIQLVLRLLIITQLRTEQIFRGPNQHPNPTGETETTKQHWKAAQP